MPRCDVDVLADNLSQWAANARSMPAGFRACGDKFPIRDTEGHHLGWMLPGEGVLLDVDLDRLGITKAIDGVFQRTPVQRTLDRIGEHMRREVQWWKRLWRDERGVITTFDGIIASRAGGKANDVIAVKDTFTTTATSWHNTFRDTGAPTSGSYTSGSGSAPNNTTTGALSIGLTDPTGGDTKYLINFGMSSSSNVNMAMIVDLLVAAGGISTTTTSPQSINTTALTRYTSGSGVYTVLEVTSALGASPANITGSYTNELGVSGQSFQSVALTPSAIDKRLMPANQMPIFPTAPGDYGVQSVQSVTLSASMGGSGTLAILLYKPLCMVPGIASNIYVERDLPASIDSLQILETEVGGALGCLTLFVFPSATSSGEIGVSLRTCAG